MKCISHYKQAVIDQSMDKPRKRWKKEREKKSLFQSSNAEDVHHCVSFPEINLSRLNLCRWLLFFSRGQETSRVSACVGRSIENCTMHWAVTDALGGPRGNYGGVSSVNNLLRSSESISVSGIVVSVNTFIKRNVHILHSVRSFWSPWNDETKVHCPYSY